MVELKAPCFQTSGIHCSICRETNPKRLCGKCTEREAELEDIIKVLDGIYIEHLEKNIRPSCTHLICVEPPRLNGKVLEAAAKGLWILKASYVTDSVECGSWQDENSYVWTERDVPATSSDVKPVRALLRTMKKRRAEAGGEAPFPTEHLPYRSIRAVIVGRGGDNIYFNKYAGLLRAGGGTVVHEGDTTPANTILCDSLSSWTSAQAHCIHHHTFESSHIDVFLPSYLTTMLLTSSAVDTSKFLVAQASVPPTSVASTDRRPTKRQKIDPSPAPSGVSAISTASSNGTTHVRQFAESVVNMIEMYRGQGHRDSSLRLVWGNLSRKVRPSPVVVLVLLEEMLKVPEVTRTEKDDPKILAHIHVTYVTDATVVLENIVDHHGHLPITQALSVTAKERKILAGTDEIEANSDEWEGGLPLHVQWKFLEHIMYTCVDGDESVWGFEKDEGGVKAKAKALGYLKVLEILCGALYREVESRIQRGGSSHPLRESTVATIYMQPDKGHKRVDDTIRALGLAVDHEVTDIYTHEHKHRTVRALQQLVSAISLCSAIREKTFLNMIACLAQQHRGREYGEGWKLLWNTAVISDHPLPGAEGGKVAMRLGMPALLWMHLACNLLKARCSFSTVPVCFKTLEHEKEMTAGHILAFFLFALPKGSDPSPTKQQAKSPPGASPPPTTNEKERRFKWKDPNSVNHQGETKLYQECKKKNPSMDRIRELLSQGADPSIVDHAGWTCLHEVAHSGNLEVAKILLESEQGSLINVNALSVKEKISPLHDAVRHRHINLVRYLIEKGADPTIQDSCHNSPLDIVNYEEDDGTGYKTEMLSILNNYKVLTGVGVKVVQHLSTPPTITEERKFTPSQIEEVTFLVFHLTRCYVAAMHYPSPMIRAQNSENSAIRNPFSPSAVGDDWDRCVEAYETRLRHVCKGPLTPASVRNIKLLRCHAAIIRNLPG